jgi:micrococcal nuclease
MYEYKGVITRVVDGDTVVASIDLGFDTTLNNIRLRFYGIDTPETYRPSCEEERKHGYEAKQFVIDHILNKEVIIKTYKDKKGKYGRYLADINFDGNNYIVKLLKEHGFEKKDNYLI